MNTQPITVTIESLDSECTGVTHIDGKTVFIKEALPRETVEVSIFKNKPTFAKARVLQVLSQSPARVIPKCPHFGVCGGCAIQHIESHEQIIFKQQGLLDTLQHIGNVTPNKILSPLDAAHWHYRHRARLSVRYVAKKCGTLVGFHERASSYVADMHECHILPPHISDLLPHLRQLIDSLSIRARIPQIEVAVGDNISVLVLRILENLASGDEIKLKEFIDTYNNQENNKLQLWLQPAGPTSAYAFYPLENVPILSYSLPQYNLNMPFLPAEFTQINPELNQKMVARAIDLLNIQATDEIADFFCGIGNFTLAIAKNKAKRVLGIEGSTNLVERAMANAKHNAIAENVNYLATDLFTIDEEWLNKLGKFDKWLIDPPRDGALALVKAITATIAPKLIVYVSCNPATLARDAAILVNVHGYTLEACGVMNMFPQTTHTESIALFTAEST